jgi:hypothetical protein
MSLNKAPRRMSKPVKAENTIDAESSLFSTSAKYQNVTRIWHRGMLEL